MASEKNKYEGIERRGNQRRTNERRTKVRFKDALGRRCGQDRRTTE